MLIGAPTLPASGPAAAAQPGEKLWEFPIPDRLVRRDCRVEAAPAIGADGTVYVAAIWQVCVQSWNNCGDVGSLYALVGATGEKVWESRDVVRSCPAIGSDGLLYAPSFQRIPGPTISWFAARNVSTGQEVWNVSTRPFEPSAPAVAADGMVYVSVGDSSVPGRGKVYALDGRDGHTAWEFPADGGWVAAPVVGAGDVVYVGSGDVGGTVYALAGATGQMLWKFVSGAPALASAAIGSDGTVYIGSYDGKFYALDGATGHEHWESLTGGAVVSSPAIGEDGTVYVGSDDKRLYALNGATGQKRWEFPTGGPVRSSPAIGADGTVYVGSDDGRLYALDGATGQKGWEFLTGGLVRSSPAISADGTVYVGSHDAKVYAISSSSVGGLARSPWPKFRGDAQNTGRVSLPAPLSLRISRQGDKVRIEWPPPGILQSTAELAPAAWQDVNGATSPHDVEPAHAQRFYRLRQPRRRAGSRVGGWWTWRAPVSASRRSRRRSGGPAGRC